MKTLSFEFSSPNNRGNFVIENNSLVFITDLEALVQKTGERLRFFYKEWLLDTQAGIPWLQEILTRPVEDSLVINLINNDLLQETEIDAINVISYDLDRKVRKFTYDLTIVSVFGSANVEFNGAVN